MRFQLIDRISELEVGVRIVADRVLTGEEDYLRDHFPLFPVMPGVLMLEAMYQASAWLIRKTDDFSHAAVVLKEARNVKYSDFVAPGHRLVVTAEIQKREGFTTTIKAMGTVDGRPAVGGRLVLESFHLGDRFPHRAAADRRCRLTWKKIFEQLYQPVEASVATVTV